MVEKNQQNQGEIYNDILQQASKIQVIRSNSYQTVDKNDIVEIKRMKLKEQLYQEKDPQQQIFLRNDITALRVMLKQINKRKQRVVPIFEIDTSQIVDIKRPYYPPERDFDIVAFEKALAVNDEISLLQMLKYEKKIIKARASVESSPDLRVIALNKANAYKLCLHMLNNKKQQVDFDLQVLVANITNQVHILVNREQVEINLSILPCQLFGDKIALEFLIFNLLWFSVQISSLVSLQLDAQQQEDYIVFDMQLSFHSNSISEETLTRILSSHQQIKNKKKFEFLFETYGIEAVCISLAVKILKGKIFTSSVINQNVLVQLKVFCAVSQQNDS